jgi:hypothetical protein
MTTITLAQALNLQDELLQLDPPPRIRQALSTVCSFLLGGVRPPTDLIQLVQSWIGQQHQQDRYGK